MRSRCLRRKNRGASGDELQQPGFTARCHHQSEFPIPAGFSHWAVDKERGCGIHGPGWRIDRVETA